MGTTDRESMNFKAGSKIRLSASPALVATFTGDVRERPGYRLLKVKLPDGGFDFWREHLAEDAPSTADRLGDFKAAKFGGAEHLQRCLMLAKIRGDLTDIFYSMNSSDIDFFPHQYQPVLKFIESPSKRLLVADEVGLGKTIEAGLIWKELQARVQASRLLIVCPAMLREKWCRELGKRFGVQARAARAGDLIEELSSRATDMSGFALVTGYEAIRPPKSPGERPGPRQKLAELLENGAEQDEPLFDLVVVDEAHYARNPDTSTNRIIRLINERSAALVLLTATPIQLGTDNLYELLRLVDQGRFNDPSVFKRLMRDNEPFVRAFSALNRTPPDIDALVSALTDLERDPSSQALAKEIRLRLSDAGNLSPEQRVSLARLFERTSMISSAMTRSRKREVLENRVKREAHNVRVLLSPLEKEFYEAVTRRILDKAGGPSGADQISRLILITRQRQMASCIPAAIKSWADRIDLKEMLFEDFGILEEDEESDDGREHLSDTAIENSPPQPNLTKGDAKLSCLLEIIDRRRQEDPGEKIVLFSYFRATLEYLKKELEAKGIATFLLHGGITDQKDGVVESFSAFQGSAILLSSEVGSEGIDLQFCSTLVNYDLPWNPMKVEQRIGRLDRLGQLAEKILIYNLVLTDTIEDRILLRLHERIGVFQRSIGDLEQILGSEVQELVTALFSSRLTDEERERQAEENITAIARRASQLMELEEQASNLFAFTNSILEEIDKSRSMKRYLDPAAVQRFVTSLVRELYPGTSIEELEQTDTPAMLSVELSARGKQELAEFLNSRRLSRSTRLCEPGRRTYLTTNPRWKGGQRIRPELIDASHPLLLWLRELILANLDLSYPLSAIGVDADKRLNLGNGIYIYAVDRWQFDGLRNQNRLVYSAIDLTRGRLLEPLESEQLILLASESSNAPLLIDDESLIADAYAALLQLTDHMMTAFEEEKAFFVTENNSLVSRQISAVRRKAASDLAELESRLSTAENSAQDGPRRTIPMIRGRIRAVDERLEIQEARLTKAGIVTGSFTEISAGIIQVQ